MQTKDLASLEFPRVRQLIADYCHCETGRKLAMDISPSTDISWIQERLAETAEARLLLNAEPDLSTFGITDISEIVRHAELGRVLDTSTLAEIRQNITVIRGLKAATGKSPADTPLLAAISERFGSFSPLEKAIDRVVTPDGELQPNASPELADIRNRIRSRRGELTDRLQGIINAETSRRFIQEPIITERAGRLALAVKAEYKNEIKGIVHDVSNSGSTVFLEPFAAMDLGNELKELDIAEAREIERILAEISGRVAQHSHSLIESIRAAAGLDLILAKARYARRVRGIEPDLQSLSTDNPPVVKLVDARHPLLGDSAVPLSIEMGSDFRLLVITGPNTGGKTVALKTLGLLSLMAQSGLPVPAGAGSRLPVFSGIFADIGDEQSVQASLSTFSGHISNIARILNAAASDSMVLLDELGGSTDPQEGSALARAILVHLAATGNIGAVTTHFSDLKVFAHITPGLRNASFDFDPDTLKPTYRITMGLPGGSNAIATAARYGLKSKIIETARGFLSDGQIQLEELLRELTAEKQRLETARLNLAGELATAESRRVALDKELTRLRQEKKAIIEEARDAVVAEVALLEKELRRARASLDREKSLTSLEQARRSSNDIRSRLRQGVLAPAETPEDATGPEDRAPAPGDRVWLPDAGVEGEVISFNDKTGQAEILAGSVKFRLGASGFTRLQGNPRRATPTGIRFQSSGRSVPMELDLRGKRMDEAEALLDAYLNDAAAANLSEIRVIHGHGTGALRNLVRETCSRHPLVAACVAAPPNLGGDGAAVIRLK